MNQKRQHYEIKDILKRKMESVQHVESTQYLYLLKKYIKCNIWMVAERGRPIYI
jgi:hypothetical protein